MYLEIYSMMKRLLKESILIKKYYVCLKASREDKTKIISLTHNQMFKLIVNLVEENEKL